MKMNKILFLTLYKKFKVQWYYDRMNNTLYAYSAFGKNPLYKTYIYMI